MISLIAPATDKAQVDRLDKSLQKLKIDYQLIAINDATSMFDSWRKGIKEAKGEYLILTHQDVEFYSIPKLEIYLKNGFGLCGPAGCKDYNIKEHAFWFDGRRIREGKLSGQVTHTGGLTIYGNYGEVKILDGVCLITKKEILEDVGIPNKDEDYTWDWYDHVLCLEYRKKGYKIRTIPIDITHYSSGRFREKFFVQAETFKKEYGEVK